MKHVPIFILPAFLGLVLVVDKNSLGNLVVLLSWQIATPFQEEDFLARWCQLVRKRADTGSGVSNDDAVMDGRCRAPRCWEGVEAAHGVLQWELKSKQTYRPYGMVRRGVTSIYLIKEVLCM